MIKIREQELNIDVLEELQEFDWEKSKPDGNEFKACSPFRSERTPSFYVNLETGLYIDHAGIDDNWKQGNLVKLLAFLYNQTYEETEDYLIEKYGRIIEDVEGLDLKINIQFDEKKAAKIFTRDELRPYLFRNTAYLLGRGISEDVQAKFIVGYNKANSSVAFFWMDAFTGKVVNVKFRSTKGKQFYYIKGGQPVRNHIFGMYQVLKDYKEGESVYIVESEIDAMYLWSFGFKAVALGGSNFSAQQKKILLLSGITNFVIATDSDKAGERIRNSLIKNLSGFVELKELVLPGYAKDVNDIKTEDIKKVTDSLEPITLRIPLQIM